MLRKKFAVSYDKNMIEQYKTFVVMVQVLSASRESWCYVSLYIAFVCDMPIFFSFSCHIFHVKRFDHCHGKVL